MNRAAYLSRELSTMVLITKPRRRKQKTKEQKKKKQDQDKNEECLTMDILAIKAFAEEQQKGFFVMNSVAID